MAGAYDLDALLAELMKTSEPGSLTPTELTARLSALGVRVGVQEVAELNQRALRSDATPGRSGVVRLDAMLEYMNADQLKLVAKRFNANANISRLAESKKAVLQALRKASLLDKVIADLSPLERALLSEAKRHGGVVNGWALIIYAALHEYKPPERPSISVYKDYLARTPGKAYLGVLLRDGLLIPASNHSSWFANSSYYANEAGSDNDLVFVDANLLARLPDEPSPPPPRLEFEPRDGVTPTSPHPLQTLLELYDVLQLMLEEGGLPITQSNAPSKRSLARLLKRRPGLEPRLERLLQLARALGLLNAPERGSTKDPWQVDLQRLHKLQTMPLVISYSLMVEAFLSFTAVASDDPWGSRYSGLVSDTVAGQALLQSLEVLPEYPVSMEEALGGLWSRVLKHVGTRHWQANDDAEPERPVWFTNALLGTFRDLGLVAVAELPNATTKLAADESAGRSLHVMRGSKVERYRSPSEGDTAYRYSVGPALGRSWFVQGQRLQQVQTSDARQLRELLELEPDTGKSRQTSLLIQPNFDILVYLDSLSPLAITALNCAECIRIDAQTASYTITRSSLYRTLEAGLELDALLTLLQEHSRGVPDNVVRSLRDWASRRERLRIQESIKLVEYANQKERDVALKTLKGARAIAERFLMLATLPKQLKATVRHQYHLAPARTLRFHPEGHFRLMGATDLAGRAVLAQFTRQSPDGFYHLDVTAIRAGTFTTAARETITARAQGGLPAQLEALMNIWEGKSASPALAKISVFQHSRASALAKYPGLGQHLDRQLNDTSYLVKAGHEKQLGQYLSKLNVDFSDSFMADIKPQAIQGSVMQSGLDTRKMRVLIETTISEARSLELRYHQEKESYNRYGYTKKSKGKLVTEKVTPESVVYSGSTPYLTGATLGTGEYRYIRIGYITGLAVL